VALAYDDYDDHHDAGSGDCVVLIHGHPFDRTLWDPQVTALRDSFRVLVPDLRGFGRSPVTPGRVTMRELAADIEELLDGLGIARAALVGLSMGGAPNATGPSPWSPPQRNRRHRTSAGSGTRVPRRSSVTASASWSTTCTRACTARRARPPSAPAWTP